MQDKFIQDNLMIIYMRKKDATKMYRAEEAQTSNWRGSNYFLVVKSKPPPCSGSSLEAVESHS